MTKSEVMYLVGPTTEIDTIPQFDGDNGGLRVVWQYGDVIKPGNQRVHFYGDIVETEVIADGLRFEELMAEFQRGGLTERALLECIKELNREVCK